MGKKYSRKQKIYRMEGCSNTRKNYLGGSPSLAYTGQTVLSRPNPMMAYTGGRSLDNRSNTNPAYPNTGPVSGGNHIFNSPQKGGCGCAAPLMGGNKENKGGSPELFIPPFMVGGCGCAAPLMGGNKEQKAGSPVVFVPAFMVGGEKKHRIGCRSSKCKSQNKMKGGNKGIPYPDGLVGSAWTPSITTWPGVNGIPGDSNYYPLNTYQNDISRQMVNVGANPPFLNLKGGKGKGKGKGRGTRKQKGGFAGQDLINLGRQFQFGIGSAYNALAGYSSPVNPMPWKDQIPSKTHLNSRMI
jgi:hypothetical protein